MELVSLARNPVPSGAVVGAFAGYDGKPMRFARWAPTRGPKRGTICILTGRDEFIEKYFETVADLRRRGFAVAVMDWRGQGMSYRALANPRKGHISSFREYDQDLVRFVKDVVLPDCPPPYTALAHSMGGNIALRNAVLPSAWFERLILTAPMLAFADEIVGYPQAMVRAYVEASCLSGFSRTYVPGGSDASTQSPVFEENKLTSDQERWSRNRAVLDAAPELGVGSPTIGWVRAAYRSCARLSATDFPGSVTVPALLFAAGKDEVVSTPAIEDFGTGLKVGCHLLIPGAKHEILQERDGVRQRFWSAFDAYMGVEVATV